MMRNQTLAAITHGFLLILLPAIAMAVTPPTETTAGIASDYLLNNPDPDHHKPSSSEEPQRVRIPITLKSWAAVPTGEKGTNPSTEARISTKPITQVLRARIERPNDFYLGDWRIQTAPVRWLKRTGQYQVRLEVFRRYGEAGQIEESLGSVLLTGMLDKQSDGLFIVQGKARRQFFDKSGHPIAELTAGQSPETTGSPSISRR